MSLFWIGVGVGLLVFPVLFAGALVFSTMAWERFR